MKVQLLYALMSLHFAILCVHVQVAIYLDLGRRGEGGGGNEIEACAWLVRGSLSKEEIAPTALNPYVLFGGSR